MKSNVVRFIIINRSPAMDQGRISVMLRAALNQSAWAASRTKNSYFRAQYRRLVGRRGKKRALVAVAHSLLVVIYHVLLSEEPYQDLGVDYFDKLNTSRIVKSHVRRLEKLGYDVTLVPVEEAA